MTLSKKPSKVLELGIGPGYVTRTVLDCLRYNGYGLLTSVDNWGDYGGVEPPHAEELRQLGATIVRSSEREFMTGCAANSYDLIISDADHHSCHQWAMDYSRVIRRGGFMFFHDTANNEFCNLASLLVFFSRLPHYEFKEKSRLDERTDRGWLMVINRHR